MRRFLVVVSVAGLILGIAGVSNAQIHDDPTTTGTTGLFTVPRAGTLEEGAWAIGTSYSRVSREEGDSHITTLGLMATYGLGYRLEVFVGFQPRVEIDRRFSAERALLAMDPQLTGLGINEHPFAFTTPAGVLNGAEHKGVGDMTVGLKYKFMGDPYKYDGMAIQGWVGFPTSETSEGIGCGCFQFGTKLIASLEAWDFLGYNVYVGYQYFDTQFFSEKFDGPAPDIARFFVSPEFLYGFGVQFPTRATVQLIGEWTGSVTTRDTNRAFTGGDDISMLQGGLRLTTDNGFTLNAAVNYNSTINLRDPRWQDDRDALDDSLRRWGWLFGASYSSNHRQPLRFRGSELADVGVLNRAPTLTCEAERSTMRQGESTRLVATASDPDGDALTVNWTAGFGSISPATGDEVTWSSRGLAPGSGTIRGRVDDTYGGTAECTVAVSVEAPPPPAEPTILHFGVGEFRSGNARIDNRMKAILDDVALQLRQNSGATAAITGYSDSRGSDEANDKAALERAENARAYLVETHSIDSSRITVTRGGSSNPVGDNSTRAGRSQNRRIEITVTIPPR